MYSVDQGNFPKQPKITNIIPIYKADDKKRDRKLQTHIICIYFYEFLKDHDLLDSRQLGFRKNHSTTHAVTTLVSRALDYGKIAAGCILRKLST